MSPSRFFLTKKKKERKKENHKIKIFFFFYIERKKGVANVVIIPTTLKFLRYIMMWDYLRALTSNVINAKFLTFNTSDTKIKKFKKKMSPS